jgi:colanic acid biosynthesis glycosyl transferase WcaI
MYWFPYEGPIPMIYDTIFEKLIERGYKISLIASFPHFRYGREEKWREYRGKFFERANWKGIDLYRTWVFAPTFKSSRFRFFFRTLNYLSFTFSSLLVGLKHSRHADVVFVPTSPPLFAAFNAWIISRIRKIPFIYNIQDLYPDNLGALGLLKKKSFFYWLFAGIEKFLFKKASRLTVISNKMKEIIAAKGIEPEKIAFIPNFHDTSRIKPQPKENRFAVEFGLLDKFIISYIGGVSFTHGLEFVLEAAGKLLQHSNIYFMIMGRGEHLFEIKEIAGRQKLTNILFIVEQPYERMNEIWASSDISLVCMRKGVSGFQVPSKTFGIMACGRPVIAMLDEGSEIWNIVKESKGGCCVPPERPDLLADTILRLYENDNERKEMGRLARNHVVNFYSGKRVTEEYDKIFMDLAAKENETQRR